MTQFIDDHRDRFGVEPICRVLTEYGVKIAPSGYYAFKSRPVSARAVRDAERQEGLRGIRRGKQFITTRADDRAVRPADHVERCFRADHPNQLGRGLHLCADLIGNGVHRVRQRRVLPSIRYAERLADVDAIASIGTVGDSYDNA